MSFQDWLEDFPLRSLISFWYHDVVTVINIIFILLFGELYGQC